MLDKNTIVRIRPDKDNSVHFSFSGVSYQSGAGVNVYSDTTEHWNSQKDLVGRKGCLYIYTDHYIDQNGNPIPAAKVGDGSAYLIDAPFIDASVEIVQTHINDKVAHITEDERDFWNNKVTAYLSADADDERLVLTKNREVTNG